MAPRRRVTLPSTPSPTQTTAHTPTPTPASTRNGYPTSMLCPVIIDDKVVLHPDDFLRLSSPAAFSGLVLQRGRDILEGYCHQHGYIIPGTLELVNYGAPVATHGRFTGDMRCFARFKATVLRPPENIEVDVIVLQHNKAGIYSKLGTALNIKLMRDYHLISPENRHLSEPKLPLGATIAEYETARVGDIVRVRILRTRFFQGDTIIIALAELMSVVEHRATAAERGEDIYAEGSEAGLQPLINGPILAPAVGSEEGTPENSELVEEIRNDEEDGGRDEGGGEGDGGED